MQPAFAEIDSASLPAASHEIAVYDLHLNTYYLLEKCFVPEDSENVVFFVCAGGDTVASMEIAEPVGKYQTMTLLPLCGE